MKSTTTKNWNSQN